MSTEIIEKDFIAVYMSRDRPLQLDLTLSTNQLQCGEWNILNEVVIYKSSSEEYEKAYQTVSKEHSAVRFFKEEDFKKDLLFCLRDKKYVVFIVDDCIFTDKYSLDAIQTALKISEDVLGFSLRLGKNTTKCYPTSKDNVMPNFTIPFDSIMRWKWDSIAEGDFSYPLEVSSSIYRIKDIMPLLENCDYNTPNSLEWIMSINTNFFKNKPYLLCYENSVAFCNPVNKIQTENNNRHGTDERYSIPALLKIFQSGGRLSAEFFNGFISNGCHMETECEVEMFEENE